MLGASACSRYAGTTQVYEVPGAKPQFTATGPSFLHSVEVQPTRLDDGWPVSTLQAEGFNHQTIGEMLRAIDAGEYTKLDSILIARNGKLVLEAYFNGFTRDSKHDMQSVTKSFTSALVGIAVDKSMIANVDAPISSYFRDYWPGITNDVDKKRRITLANLLTMSTGFDAEESWGIGPKRVRAMRQSPDWIKYVLDLPMASEPGARFSYNSATTFLIGRVVARASGEPLPVFSRKHLFEPLDITDCCWSLTPHRRALTNSAFFMRPRDMLKFGQLYLDGGVWRGRRVISQRWIAESTRARLDAARPDPERKEPSRKGYGYQWWTGLATNPAFNHFYATGNGGQKIFVFPVVEMVVVFTGSHYEQAIGHRQPTQLLNRYIAPAALSASALN